MNRDEAVKKIAREGYISIEHAEDLYDTINPKPVVPQYVADWYEEHKENLDEAVWEYMVNWEDDEPWDDFKRWMSQAYENGAITTLVNMHQYGYEVEKEPRYTVKVKGIDKYSAYLNKNLFNQEWFFGNCTELRIFRAYHTRKELEEGSFDWVFDCDGVEVIEVD